MLSSFKGGYTTNYKGDIQVLQVVKSYLVATMTAAAAL